MRCTADNTSIRNASPRPGPCDSYHCRTSSSSISAIWRTGPSRPVFGDDLVQIFGCELTAAVGRQTGVGLVDPKAIDSRIGAIKAVQNILHQREALRRCQLASLLAKGLSPLAH